MPPHPPPCRANTKKASGACRGELLRTQAEVRGMRNVTGGRAGWLAGWLAG